MPVVAGRLMAQWVEIARPGSLPDRMWPASVYDPVNDKIYMIGGSSVNLCQRYDPNRDTWEMMRPMRTPRYAIGGAYIRGRIYVVGGYPGDLDVNEEYTMATFAYQVAVWRDSLMYIMGGIDPNWNGMETVRIYNPFTDTWTVGTPMPRQGDMGSGTIVGDTIYITGANQRDQGLMWTEMLRGAINPADPTQITWLSGPQPPVPVACQGTASLNGKVYWLGGLTSETGSTTRSCWVYDPATGVIESIPTVPPTDDSGLVYSSAVGREATSELYQIAGRPDYSYHRLTFSPQGTGEAGPAVMLDAFRNGVQIHYEIDRPCRATLTVYDRSGRVVRTLVSAQVQAGSYAAAWDGRDRYGRPAGSGVYFCRLQAGEFTTAGKMVKTE